MNFLAHDVQEEIDCWRKCLELNPAFDPAYSCLGKVYMDRGKFAEAAGLMREATKADPANAEFPNLQASAPAGNEPAARAILLLEERSRTCPDSLPTFFLLGQSYSRVSQFDKAKSFYEKAIRLYPEYTLAYDGLAAACTHLGEQESAKKYREVFQTLKAKDRESHLRARTG